MCNRNTNSALIRILCILCLQAVPAHAQSRAAMQVCAEILAQYGIAPEGCDPHDDELKAASKEKTSNEAEIAPTPIPSVQARQELDENNIFFRSGGNKLDKVAMQKIDKLGQVLNASLPQNACFRLVGHSDSSGPASVNQTMGLKRAQKVAGVLGPKLNDPARILEIRSDGETSLISALNPESVLHRRVTIYAKDCPKP